MMGVLCFSIPINIPHQWGEEKVIKTANIIKIRFPFRAKFEQINVHPIMKDSSSLSTEFLSSDAIPLCTPGPLCMTSWEGRGKHGKGIGHAYETHAACCAKSNEVLCLCSRSFISSASIYENGMQVES